MPRRARIALASDSAVGRTAVVLTAALALIAALNLVQVRSPDMMTLKVGSPTSGVLIIVAAAITALAYLRWPTFALCSLVVLVGANLSEVLVRFHGLPSVLQLLAVPLALTVAAQAWREDLGSLRRPLVALAGAYGVVALASTAWAESPEIADAAVAEHLRGIAILAAVAVLVSDRRRLRIACGTLVATSAAIATLGVLQGVSGDPWGEFWGLARIKHAQIYGDVFTSRIAGPLGDPNFFAQNLLLVLPLAVAMVVTARSPLARVTWSGTAAAILGGIFFTYSRGAALALLAQGLLALPLLAATHRRTVLRIAAVSLVALLVLPTGFATRLATITQLLPGEEAVIHPDSSFEKRRVVTTAAWRMFLDNPVLGVGAGNYTVHFDRYAAEIDSPGREYRDPAGDQRQYPHDLYLEVASETGFVGLATFLLLVVGGLLMLRGALVSPAGPVLRPWSLALAIGIGGYLVAAIFLHGQFQRGFWLSLGLVSAVHAIGHRSTEDG